MNDNSEKNQGTLVELIFMPMAFYVFTQLDKIDSWQKIVLWSIVFVLIQNEYFSIKNASPKYNFLLHFPDYLSVFMYWFALGAITKSNPIIPAIGYDPMFWIYISVLWLGYAIWDWIMMYNNNSSHEKEDYRRWRNNMFICLFVTSSCGVALLSIQPSALPNIYIMSVLQLLPLCCVLWALGGWWLKSILIKQPVAEAKNVV